jgi:hypothetical protein
MVRLIYLSFNIKLKNFKFQNYLDPNNFKNHSLPLARIKKIMKLDDEVKVNLFSLDF